MYKTIRVKKAFTLIEMIIVIILVSTLAFLAASNFTFFDTQKRYKVNIENVKDFMLKNFKFNDELSLVCIEDDSLNCYVFIDEVEDKKNKIENLFNQVPEVYNYDKDLSDYEFTEIRLDETDYEPFFELKINKDRKHKNIILDTIDNKVYLFSSISKKPEIFNDTNEIIDRFFELETEVKDAF